MLDFILFNKISWICITRLLNFDVFILIETPGFGIFS